MLNSIANGISGSLGSYVMELLYRMPAILVALAFHEWAHAYAAYKLGDPTAYNLGRMTLNPLAHIDLIGLIMMMLVRFGWAKPVPVSTRNFKHPRRDEIIVSLAGVAMNLVLAFVTMLIFFGRWWQGKPATPPQHHILLFLLYKSGPLRVQHTAYTAPRRLPCGLLPFYAQHRSKAVYVPAEVRLCDTYSAAYDQLAGLALCHPQ